MTPSHRWLNYILFFRFSKKKKKICFFEVYFQTFNSTEFRMFPFVCALFSEPKNRNVQRKPCVGFFCLTKRQLVFYYTFLKTFYDCMHLSLLDLGFSLAPIETVPDLPHTTLMYFPYLNIIMFCHETPVFARK